MTNYHFLDEVVQIQKLSKKLEKIDVKLKIKPDDKLHDQKNDMLEKIESLRGEYYQNLLTQDNHAQAAIVTFRSMEGAERALKAFQTNFLQRWCCTASKKKLKFHSKYLLVE